MLYFFKILPSVSDKHGTIELGIAADLIVVAGLEPPPGLVEPRLVRAECAVTENAVRIARRRVVAYGQVQGVFFRASVKRLAEGRGVFGWARNRSDGTMEACFEGAAGGVIERGLLLHEGTIYHVATAATWAKQGRGFLCSTEW